MSASRRARLVAAALLTAVFIAGLAVGVALDRYANLGGGPGVRAVVLSDMSGVLDKLELTPQQRVQAGAIIERSAPRTEQTMLEVADRLRAISDSVDSELRAILTPPQRLRLDSLRVNRRLMLKRKMVTPAGTKVDTVFPRP
jgi:hypothetical protein